MYNKFSAADILRRIEIVARVINGETITKADAAFEYDVSEITINRDLQWLRSEGIDIFTRKSLIQISNHNLDLISNLSTIYLSLKNHSGIISSVKILEQQKKSSHKLVLISKAISEQNKIEIEYSRLSDDETKNYYLNPYELKLVGLNWILKAIKDGENILQSFYVSRIGKITISNKTFDRQNSGENLEKHEIVLRFSPEVKSQLYDKIWFDEFEISEDDHGYAILKTKQPITNSLASWCISWWDKIEIVQSRALRMHIEDMIKSFSSSNYDI